MQNLRTASGRLLQSPALVETQLPVPYDASLNPGARVLGSDGRVYEAVRDGSGQYTWKARAQGPNLARVDTSSAGSIYAGTAPFGTAENSSAWTIVRATFDSAGTRTSRGTATNVAWSSRTTATYS
jgi:hypothetical protein